MQHAHDPLTRERALDVAGRRRRLHRTFHFSPGVIHEQAIGMSGPASRAATRLWRRDASLWSADAAAQRRIANRLGWLASPALMADTLGRIESFAVSIRDAHFSDVVLLGMGGSSLAPEVLRAVIGVAAGWPRFHMLDSTDPAAVRAVETPVQTTLYILASKSGTTIEPNALAAYFRRELENARVAAWADHFVAVTDEGTPLARRARDDGFREVFINPSDIGGRYSALSFFGLVPAALMGSDISALDGWALAMLAASEPDAGDVMANPSVALGLAIAAAAQAGRDKLTLVLPPELEAFGLWVEQLVAESTGKEGLGIVPVAGEPLADPPAYHSDRMLVRLRLPTSRSDEMEGTRLAALKAAGVPLVDIELPEASAVGAEFVRWEIGTAVAGALLGIDPFDEPNVQQAKDATRALLDQYQSHGRLSGPTADLTLDDGTTLVVSSAARRHLDRHPPEALLALLQKGDYFALLAYLGPDRALAGALRTLRLAVGDRTGAATMFGYGPRYLHSTGQLHKGGPNTGLFVLVSATPREDLDIAGQPFSFGTLERAQALGDFAALDAAGRRALHAHLPEPDPQRLRRLAGLLLAHLPSPGRT